MLDIGDNMTILAFAKKKKKGGGDWKIEKWIYSVNHRGYFKNEGGGGDDCW